MSEQEPRGQEKGRDYWLRYVDDRAVSLDEALKKCLKSGSKISTGFAGGLPLALYRRIGAFSVENDLSDLQIASAMLTEPFDFLYGGIKMSDSLVTKYKKFKAAAETRRRVRYVSGFMSPVTATKIPLLRGKSLYEAGLTALYPYHFYNIINFHWAPEEDPWCDVGVGLVSPPDENGFCSFGPASDTLHAIVNKAIATGRSKLIALVNPNVPRTYGTPEEDNAVRVDSPNITCIVKDDTELAHLPVDPRKRPDRMKTAENAAELIPDGATLQIGIGDISSRVCMALLERGWHGREYSEMLPDALFKLFEEGRIAGTHIQRGSEREYVEGKLCCTFAMAVEGSDMYKKLDYNRDIIFMPAHKQVIAEGFTDCWGVNNGLSIDLTGQLTAESRGASQYSGPGGLPAIVRGLNEKPKGGSIICLPSVHRQKKKMRSNIRPVLPAGAVVTVPRSDLLGMAHRHCYIVTEYGAAQLAGKTVDEVARELVAVAHPEFRPWLRKQAWKRWGIVFPR